MIFGKKGSLAEFNALTHGALRDCLAESAVDRLKSAAGNFIGLICEDRDSEEIQASAIALSSLAAFMAGLAAARTGQPVEDAVRACQEDFFDCARQSFRGHSRHN